VAEPARWPESAPAEPALASPPAAVSAAPALPVPSAPIALAPAAQVSGSAALGPQGLPNSLPDYLHQVERDIILRALAQTQFNRTQAAQLLGISFRQLRYQMQKLGIQEPEQ
jgi:two-component system response regulator PilR (NtrC family)